MAHDKIRYGDEYQCAKCGKAWSIDEDDVPECTPMTAIKLPATDANKIIMLETQIHGLIQMFGEYGGEDDERLHWTPLQWFTYISTITR